MTPQEIIRIARNILLDVGVAVRQSDAEVLDYVNDALRECSTLAPQLFYAIGDMECTPDTCEQGVSFADAQLLVEVLRLKGGRAVWPVDADTLSRFSPDWSNATPAPAVHWFRYVEEPLRFCIYPPAPAGQVLEVRYVRNPQVLELDTVIEDVPLSMRPALVSYVVYRAEMKDDEHVLSQRAMGEYQKFVAALRPGGAA